MHGLTGDRKTTTHEFIGGLKTIVASGVTVRCFTLQRMSDRLVLLLREYPWCFPLLMLAFVSLEGGVGPIRESAFGLSCSSSEGTVVSEPMHPACG